MEQLILKLRGILSDEEFIEYDRFYRSPVINQNESYLVGGNIRLEESEAELLHEENQVVRQVKNELKRKKSITLTLGGKTGVKVTAVIRTKPDSLQGKVAFVSGAAGAIGHGICKKLLEEGCFVAASDINPKRLDELVTEFAREFETQILGIQADVTNAGSVSKAIDKIVNHWGGLDFAVVNAGVAHVAKLEKLILEDFQRLEKINIEGTLITLSEVSKRMKQQGIGGDIVLVSTKNVFAPGAGFGAYSATKAASHQLARIASLELAESNIRVNMVSPDAVFSSGSFKSGLWQEVGPGRMKARGLDARGLEDYYQNRNLLKAKVTARHVGNAVVFFLSRQTPTTGATIPVDGGLPDATPR